MISWYIDSLVTDETYLKRVESIVKPCMEYFCDRLSNIENYELNDIKNLFKDIINELPILVFCYDEKKDDFFFRYNSKTLIRFNESLKSISREIILNEILKYE
jgi:hypothetical protein